MVTGDLPMVNVCETHDHFCRFIHELKIAVLNAFYDPAGADERRVVMWMTINIAEDLDEKDHLLKPEAVLILRGLAKGPIAAHAAPVESLYSDVMGQLEARYVCMPLPPLPLVSLKLHHTDEELAQTPRRRRTEERRGGGRGGRRRGGASSENDSASYFASLHSFQEGQVHLDLVCLELEKKNRVYAIFFLLLTTMNPMRVSANRMPNTQTNGCFARLVAVPEQEHD